MKLEVARRRIESFQRRFGQAHLIFAYHGAFPLALTPDLLYKLWANFQRDIHGKALGIPWVAVADLLLSSLCNEVGHELYEMDGAVRKALLSRLQEDENFGQQRINELSDFLLVYVRQQLQSSDPDVRDFAQAQRWTALAYVQPNEAARELREALKQAYQQDKAEQVRLASLVKTFAEPLAGFEPLLVYVEKVNQIARTNILETVIADSKLIVKYTDITTLTVDVVVSSDDTYLSMGGGVSRAILKAAGEKILEEIGGYPIDLGDVTVTQAGELQAQKIFHAAVLDYNIIPGTNLGVIRSVTKKCLEICDQLGYHSIAFPALATGAARLSAEESAFAMITEIATYLISRTTTIEKVIIALYPRHDLGLSQDTIGRFSASIIDMVLAWESAAKIDYSKLKLFLEKCQWKEADEETATLMLRMAGREKESYFDDITQIDNLPGEFIRIIDSFWLHYSNDRFGFSVQKRIYKNLGGTREYNKKIWEIFGNRVGWRADNKWLLYVYLNFSIDAPEGCYPAKVLRVYAAGGVWVVNEFSGALLYRPEL